MKTRFAFAGFRHAHIFDLLAGVRECRSCEVVACCEADASTRHELSSGERVRITHESFAEMLAAVECDVVAIGDVYAQRGELAIAALRASRHVLSDKPLCTSLGEQHTIEELVAVRGLSVGLQLDSRSAPALVKLREILQSGELGEICTVSIAGQHPLLLRTRPSWYFAPGQHGGTINDIGIHAFDFVPWLTGQRWMRTVAARSWNAKAREFPHFHDCAQVVGGLENGAGVLADFSYLAPDKTGYLAAQYWRVTIHGTRGFAETHWRAEHVTIALDDSERAEERPAPPVPPRRYLADFLRELRGTSEPDDLRTADCLRASRLALEAQQRAESRAVSG